MLLREDLAAWLGGKLAEKGIETAERGQEDWGWYLKATYGKAAYFLAISGNREGNTTNKDEGEWRVIVEKRRSHWARVSGKDRIMEDDKMLMVIEQILRDERDFWDLHHERDS